MGPEVLFGSNQRPKGVSILLFISFKKGQTSDPVPSLLGKYKLSYFVINKQNNKPWTWSKSKCMTLGPSWPLRPFMVGYRWSKSCKRVTGNSQHIYKRPYFVRQRQQYVSRTSSSGPRPFPSAYSSSGRKEEGAHPLQPSLQESIPGSRYWLPLQMFTVRSLILYNVFSVY